MPDKLADGSFTSYLFQSFLVHGQRSSDLLRCRQRKGFS